MERTQSTHSTCMNCRRIGQTRIILYFWIVKIEMLTSSTWSTYTATQTTFADLLLMTSHPLLSNSELYGTFVAARYSQSALRDVIEGKMFDTLLQCPISGIESICVYRWIRGGLTLADNGVFIFTSSNILPAQWNGWQTMFSNVQRNWCTLRTGEFLSCSTQWRV